ncbi:MAG TPA: aminoglycoside phosphotransferase family protein [Acidimicrobiales bacterium]|nr:aminoglycoside phosphotransferase family protein [Acidimicrobiales bacterium]
MPDDRELDALLDRLVRRGVLPPDVEVRVAPFVGGVSADVIALSFGDRRLVVKRALGRLRVAQEWLSSPIRVIVEADALGFARRIRPDNVPEILDVDEETLTIVMTAAPPNMRDWKSELLEGVTDPAVGRSLGLALADWHSASGADPDVRRRFADRSHFSDLRVSPFFETAADVHRDLAPTIGAVVERMMGRAVCLVHGDFSPKNVLVAPGSFWVVDWEIAHIGDPTFDLAFLVSHLVCKAIHRPGNATGYRACSEVFLDSYFGASTVSAVPEDLLLQVGCLLLARVDGKSPATYLGPIERERARAVGRGVLSGEIADAADLWGRL